MMLLKNNKKQKLFAEFIIIRSCDPEEWSNDAEKSDLHHRNNCILKYITIENSRFKL